MNKIFSAALFAIATSLLAATSVYAQDAALVFDALDTDNDGNVSQEEASLNEFVAQGFAAADQNSDGLLSQEEFLAAFSGN